MCNENNTIAIQLGSFFNCYPECNGYYYLDNEGNFNCIEDSGCPEDYNKLVSQRGQCTDSCSKIFDYQYEFRNQCYNICPSDISYRSEDNKFFCEVKCNKQRPFEIVKEQNCTNFCDTNENG